jgi:hypothetical protein
MSKLLVVKLDRANVLVAAMDSLHLAVAPQRLRNLWSRDTQRQQHQEDQHDHAKQQEALLTFVFRISTDLPHHRS